MENFRDRVEPDYEAGSLDEEVFHWFTDDGDDGLSQDAPKVGRPRIPEAWSRCISLQGPVVGQ